MGEIIKQAVTEKDFSITTLAERLHKSRQHIYNLFNSQEIPLETIIKIGKIIQHDFSDSIKIISEIPKEYKLDQLTKADISTESNKYWKARYFELLEQHKLLLKNKLKEYFESNL